MPILAAEVSLFPEQLLEDTWSDESFGRIEDAETERRWWVLHTKVRQEKALARHLANDEIPFYLPLIPKDHLFHGRRVRSFLPLFGGYVFLYGTDAERVRGMTSNRIAYVLEVPDQERLWRDLQQIHQLILSDAPLTVERRMEVGQHVRIRRGAFAGIEGVLVSRRGRTRLLVSVSFLGQGASVEIEDLCVEPI